MLVKWLSSYMHQSRLLINVVQKANVAEVMNIIGEVKGKVAVLIDDMIDTAGTITLAAQAIKDAGALEVYACCTHAVLSGPALDRINDSVIKEVVVTDSIEVPEEKTGGKIVQISVDQLMAEANSSYSRKPFSEYHCLSRNLLF